MVAAKIHMVLLLVCCWMSSFSQSFRSPLFDDDPKLPGPVGPNVYRVIERQEQLFLIRDYYAANRQLAMEARASQMDPVRYHGQYKSFHENGKRKLEGKYVENFPVGIWKAYHENGQQAEERFYEHGNTFYLQWWSESGDPMLVDGFGAVKRKNSRGEDEFLEIVKKKHVGTYSIDKVTRDTLYTVVEKNAHYNGGMPAFYEMVGKHFRYPKSAREDGVNGKIWVELIIGKSGKVEQVKTIAGPRDDVNLEAERVMRMSKDWIPASVNGKSVRTRMVLVIACSKFG